MAMLNAFHKFFRYSGFVFLMLIMTIMLLKANGMRMEKWTWNVVITGMAISFVAHFILDEIKKRGEPMDLRKVSSYLMMVTFLSLMSVLLLLKNDVAVNKMWLNISIIAMLVSWVLNFIAQEMKKKEKIPPMSS